MHRARGCSMRRGGELTRSCGRTRGLGVAAPRGDSELRPHAGTRSCGPTRGLGVAAARGDSELRPHAETRSCGPTRTSQGWQAAWHVSRVRRSHQQNDFCISLRGVGTGYRPGQCCRASICFGAAPAEPLAAAEKESPSRTVADRRTLCRPWHLLVLEISPGPVRFESTQTYNILAGYATTGKQDL